MTGSKSSLVQTKEDDIKLQNLLRRMNKLDARTSSPKFQIESGDNKDTDEKDKYNSFKKKQKGQDTKFNELFKMQGQSQKKSEGIETERLSSINSGDDTHRPYNNK